ncbi:hypothetical protein [Borborobacter arsenicus]|uniref:hypothetical protein n=1 Tax=Borborobacter arsenicus TaxID=1851146 RepID=UPI001FDF50E3|nr:hypothetical protein [Pseudaminobacter arsenicus]
MNAERGEHIVKKRIDRRAHRLQSHLQRRQQDIAQTKQVEPENLYLQRTRSADQRPDQRLRDVLRRYGLDRARIDVGLAEFQIAVSHVRTGDCDLRRNPHGGKPRDLRTSVRQRRIAEGAGGDVGYAQFEDAGPGCNGNGGLSCPA